MDLKEYKDYLVKFLKDYATDHKIKGFTVGVSGGIDSAVVTCLLKETGLPVQAVIIPIDSTALDIKDALELCVSNGVNYKVVDLTKTYKKLHKQLKLSNKLANANIKPRLRMTTLFALAQEEGHIVVGTDNADEFYTGYFTKFGDGAYDIMPLRYMVKSEVYELAKMFNIPESIMSKAPTAGIMDGVTDESEMGVTYKDLDNYLLGKKVDKDIKEKIELLHTKSEHKRNTAVLPKEYKR